MAAPTLNQFLDIELTRDWVVSAHIPFFGGLTGTADTALLNEPLPEKVFVYPLRDGHVDPAFQAEFGDQAAPAGADRSGGVGLVDDHPGAVALGELDDFGQRRKVAVHREDRVGDDGLLPASGTPQCVGKGIHVGMGIDDRLGTGQAAAVHQRSVVELVG